MPMHSAREAERNIHIDLVGTEEILAVSTLFELDYEIWAVQHHMIPVQQDPKEPVHRTPSIDITKRERPPVLLL